MHLKCKTRCKIERPKKEASKGRKKRSVRKSHFRQSSPSSRKVCFVCGSFYCSLTRHYISAFVVVVLWIDCLRYATGDRRNECAYTIPHNTRRAPNKQNGMHTLKYLCMWYGHSQRESWRQDLRKCIESLESFVSGHNAIDNKMSKFLFGFRWWVRVVNGFKAFGLPTATDEFIGQYRVIIVSSSIGFTVPKIRSMKSPPKLDYGEKIESGIFVRKKNTHTHTKC